MKKYVYVLVSICILFLNCACQQEMPDLSDGKETATGGIIGTQDDPVLTEQELPKEETTEPMVETQPIISGDMPSLILESESEYQKFIAQCKELPESFVKYEDLSTFGEFQGLTFSVLGDYGYYLYTLEDSAGFAVQISVNHTPEQNSDYQILAFETSVSDLRHCGSGNEGLEIFQKGELQYYYSYGELLCISWTYNGINYCVKGGFATRLSDYPQNAEATALSGLLRIDTAENTYNNLFADK